MGNSSIDARRLVHQTSRMAPIQMNSREPHSIAETRKFIRQASFVFGSIEIGFERDGEWDADSVSVRITKKQALEVIGISIDKGDQILCHFDGYTLRIT